MDNVLLIDGYVFEPVHDRHDEWDGRNKRKTCKFNDTHKKRTRIWRIIVFTNKMWHMNYHDRDNLCTTEKSD